MAVVLRWGAFFLVFGIFLSLAPPAYSTHEADHRFEVFGTVRDAGGKPVADAKVIIVDSRVDQGTTVFTGSDGKYKATLHLHNENLGDEIVVAAQGDRKTVRAEFDPADTESKRSVRVDFGAPAAPGSENRGIGKIAALGSVLLVIAALVVVYARKSRRRSGGKKTKGGSKRKKS
ncbi:MAG TPA: carboxypeptidase-like regulatory domain-containing protein [Nitrospiria bacterium]